MRTVHYHGDMSSDARMQSVESFSAAASGAAAGPASAARAAAPSAAAANDVDDDDYVFNAADFEEVGDLSGGFPDSSEEGSSGRGVGGGAVSGAVSSAGPLVMVCTDLAARGLDFGCRVDHIVNFDFPRSNVDYLHRAGRTARAGAKGAQARALPPAARATLLVAARCPRLR